MMYKFLKFSVWVGLLVLPAISMGAPPYANDQWSVATGGVISGCPATAASCSTIISDPGFIQQLVTATDGTQHVRSITTDIDAAFGIPDGTEAFSSENWVEYNNTGGSGTGISATMNIYEAPGGQTFSTTADINTGLAFFDATAGVDEVVLSQTIDQPETTAGMTGDQFNTTFFYGADLLANGSFQDFRTDITQNVGLMSMGGLATDKQKFAYTQTDRTDGTGSPITLSATAVPWVVNDTISATWIGQQITDTTGGGMGTSLFTFSKIENLSTPAMAEEYNLTSVGPIANSWPTDAGFGGPPVF